MKVSHDSETPAEGQQVFTACAFIWRERGGEKQVFMAKRADTKKFMPGIWELPGGHIDYAEDMVDGLKREIREEFSMSVTVGEPFAVFTYLNQVKQSHSIEVVYFAQFIEDDISIRIDPEDHSAYAWFSQDQLYQTHTATKGSDNPEARATARGFELLLQNGVLRTK
ncbi:NUDIX hydrolase [Candidatus Saccharibacteria bacterium]|nr:NUDIX hydrolase [Candidatus Saccharibacteria bacterium]